MAYSDQTIDPLLVKGTKYQDSLNSYHNARDAFNCTTVFASSFEQFE